MNKREIISRLQADPNSFPTLEEIDFIMEDNKKETLELSKVFLERAEESHANGEKYIDTPAAEGFLELEGKYQAANVELWDHHNRTEGEWLKVRNQLADALDKDENPEKFYTAILEFQDERRMTRH